jgi:F-type H+-transporting ATPase subunit gamma
MANMREIKLRIKSIKETRQITKAMKLISAAKLKKARQQLEQTLPFFNKVKLTLADILMHSGKLDNIYFDLRKEKEGRKTGYLIITGDKGLAGGYNHNIIKLAEKHIKDHSDSILYVAGHTGRSYFNRKNSNLVQDFDYVVQNPTVYRAREIAELILDSFSKGELDEVFLVYTKMISTIKLEPEVMQLLPLKLESLIEDLKLDKNAKADPETAQIINSSQNDKSSNDDSTNSGSIKYDNILSYEPSYQAVFDVLIPKYVKGIVYGALVEAFTSEQSARMTAMDNATSNADDILQNLNLHYNRARQSAITQEISEIVGGAAALK